MFHCVASRTHHRCGVHAIQQTVNTTHLASLSLDFLIPYAIAGEGIIKIPATAADIDAMLSMNPRREVVPISLPSFVTTESDVDVYLVE